MCRHSLDRSIIQDGQKISFFNNGIISLPGLLNMFEVMPMLMGDEMALKADENGENCSFRWGMYAPLLSLLSFLPSLSPVLLSSSSPTRLEVVAEEEEEAEEEEDG
jgi:hypothetical protein